MTATRAELYAAGVRPNRFLWLGSGWAWCRVCALTTKHEGWSDSKGRPFEVCQNCGCYSGRERIQEP